MVSFIKIARKPLPQAGWFPARVDETQWTTRCPGLRRVFWKSELLQQTTFRKRDGGGAGDNDVIDDAHVNQGEGPFKVIG
jgi:hypothetical protein